jgi:hypothetical protein
MENLNPKHGLSGNSYNDKSNNFKEKSKGNNKKFIKDSFSSKSILESVKNPVQEFKSKDHKRKKWNPKDFPIHVLPKLVQELVLESNQKLNFPIDFSCSSSLYALSVAIGNSYHVQLKEGFTQNASLFLVMIARAGCIKSHPLKLFIKPLKKLDKESHKLYSQEIDQYEIDCENARKEKSKEDSTEVFIKPEYKQRILDDFTIEALIKAHKLNSKGLGLHIDEFTSWIERFDRYKNAAQEQYFLSIWNGDSITVNRIGDGHTQIDKTFISIAGTSQTRLIIRALKTKIDSGLLDRVLICQPDISKKEAWNRLKMNPEIIQEYENYLTGIAENDTTFSENNAITPHLVNFKSEAMNKAIEWNEKFTNEANEEKLDQIKQLYSKFDLYFLRFCLILQISKYYASETKSLDIELETVEGAIDLVDYFMGNGERFRNSFFNSDDPLSNLNELKRTIYDNLEKKFKTSDAIAFGETLNYSKRSVNSFLKNKILFKKLEHGFYEKKID